MKRIPIHEFGGPEVLRIEEAEAPRPRAAEVVVRIVRGGRESIRHKSAAQRRTTISTGLPRRFFRMIDESNVYAPHA